MEPLQPFCTHVGVTSEGLPRMEETSINAGSGEGLGRSRSWFSSRTIMPKGQRLVCDTKAGHCDRMLPELVLGSWLPLSLWPSLCLSHTHTHTPMTPRCYTIRLGLDFTRLLSALAVQPSAAQLWVIRNAFSCRAPRRPISWPPGAGCCTLVKRVFQGAMDEGCL